LRDDYSSDIVGFLFGASAVASAVSQLLNVGFLTTPVGWIAGILVGLLFAILAHVIWSPQNIQDGQALWLAYRAFHRQRQDRTVVVVWVSSHTAIRRTMACCSA
jgi:cyanate permease